MAFHVMGTGSALPAREVTNDDLSHLLDTSDEWIRTRTGIQSRRLCTTETLDELAVQACEQALARAGVSASDIDLIICSTTSGDHLVPAEACAIAEKLGARCPAFDISAACAGFIFALDIAEGWFVRGRAQRVLLVSAEKFSRLLDWTDRTTCVLFGDGAAACVLGEGGASPLYLHLDTDPAVEPLDVPGPRGTSPYDTSERPESKLSMQGRKVFKFGVNAICDETEAACRAAGVELDEVDHFVFHQANERILRTAVERLGIDDEKVAHTLAHTGNISSACIPYALDCLSAEGSLKDGQLVLLVGFGAGMDTGTCLLRWGPPSAE